MPVIICVLAVSYCCVFFLKKAKHKIAALFAVDSLVLLALFIMRAAPSITAAFIISAAAVNLTVFFMPVENKARVFMLKDFAAIFVNSVMAVFAVFYIMKNPLRETGFTHAPAPAIIVFLFMALSVVGYFTAAAGTGEKK